MCELKMDINCFYSQRDTLREKHRKLLNDVQESSAKLEQQWLEKAWIYFIPIEKQRYILLINKI